MVYAAGPDGLSSDDTIDLDTPSPLGACQTMRFAATLMVVACVTQCLQVVESPKGTSATDWGDVVNDAGGSDPPIVATSNTQW